MTEPASLPRRRAHRITFVAAALYNVAWGLFAALRPQWLFEFAGMEPMRHPAVFACVGMIVGVYGILYLEVARRPERGFLLAAVGLLGKVLGPAGWLYAYLSGEWPLASIVTILTNDLVWWVPFGLYLHDSWAFYRRDLRGTA